MTETGRAEDTASREDAARKRRFGAMLAVAGLITLVGLGVWLALDDADQQVAATPQAAIDDFPSLQDLAEQSDSPANEDLAPDFSVPTAQGAAFTLSHHLRDDGRPVILNLWASWCAPCRAEMPEIDAFAAANPDVAVIGVAVQDDVVSAEQFAAEIAVGYTLGFDEKDQVNDAYRPLGLPATFFIAADGTIAKRHFGLVTQESLAQDAAELFG